MKKIIELFHTPSSKQVNILLLVLFLSGVVLGFSLAFYFDSRPL